MISGWIGVAHGVFDDHLRSRQPPRPGGLDVLHVENVQQVAAHHADQRRRAAGARPPGWAPTRCLSRSTNLAKLQGRLVFRGKEPAHRLAKHPQAITIRTRASKKFGMESPAKPKIVDSVVAQRVLVGGGIDADGDGDDPGQEQGAMEIRAVKPVAPRSAPRPRGCTRRSGRNRPAQSR